MNHTLSHFVLLLKKDFASFCNNKLQQINLSQGLLYFVLYIGKHPDCSPSALSESLCFDAGHTTRSIEKLAQLGLVSRQKSVRDKRAYSLHLTPTGEEAFQVVRNLFSEWDQMVLSSISAEERVELLSLLGKLKISGEMKNNFDI